MLRLPNGSPRCALELAAYAIRPYFPVWIGANNMTPSTPERFVRDRFTWLAYFMLAYYAYLQATLGPASPFLRAELSLNYTVTALHVSAFALGMVLAGLTGERAARRWGRRFTFWGGAAGMALGAVMITLGRSAPVTIGSSFVMGLIGSFLLVMIQASLSDKHGKWRAIPLTESNVAAALSAGLAPLLIGALESSRIGWRGALLLPAVCIMFVVGRYHREHVPEAHHENFEANKARRALPRVFWLYWLIVFFSVSVEWCTIFWSADFLEKVVGLPKVNAATLVSVFFVAQFVGRYVGSRLVQTIDGALLLLAALGLSLAGFLCFWLSPLRLLNVIGLFITGLGVANLYPLGLAVTSSLAPDQANVASGRISFGSGFAILVAPQLLGGLADQIGIHRAYGIVAFLLVAALMAFFASRRRSGRGPGRSQYRSEERSVTGDP